MTIILLFSCHRSARRHVQALAVHAAARARCTVCDSGQVAARPTAAPWRKKKNLPRFESASRGHGSVLYRMTY